MRGKKAKNLRRMVYEGRDYRKRLYRVECTKVLKIPVFNEDGDQKTDEKGEPLFDTMRMFKVISDDVRTMYQHVKKIASKSHFEPALSDAKLKKNLTRSQFKDVKLMRRARIAQQMEEAKRSMTIADPGV